jgi:queuine tRNA-ribosyltransferase subunit QTRTD1
LNGEDAEKMAFEEIGPIVNDVLELLPVDKVRIMYGAFDPELVLDLVCAGVDVFDSSYPYLVTERDSALVFNNKTNPGGKSDADGANGHLSCGHELLMTAPIHRSDMGPLLDSCDCYSCRKHTRAYIHHLLTVREMLGKVLLMIHNLHHYKVFFDTIREAIKRDSLQEVKDMIVQSKKL